MPKHIVRLVGGLVILAIVLVVARNHLVVRSFYEFGHYRGDSVAEIAADHVKVAPSAYYRSFYPAVYETWSTGIHKPVQCTVCHGPVALGATPNAAKLEDSAQLCVNCHAMKAGRPASQPQVNVIKHSGKQQCINCHNPHSPLLTSAGRNLVSEASSEESDDLSGGEAPAPVANKGPIGNAAAGQAKATLCMTCHGVEKIVRNTSAGPNLAGQTDDHIAASLRAFQAGKRSSVVMEPIAKSLKADEINDLAAWFAGAGNKR